MTTAYVSMSGISCRNALIAVAGTAVLTLCGALGPCGKAKAHSSQSSASDETRALILGPLQDELRALQTPQASFSRQAEAMALGRSLSFNSFVGEDPADTRPAASRLAASALSTHADMAAIEGLITFQQPGTTLIETPSGGRLSVALFDGHAPDAALLAISPSYAELAGSDLDPAGRDRHRMALRYETRFEAPGGFDGLDVGLAPRAGVSIGEDGPAAEAGATVRLGQYLGDGFGEDRPAWWFFAGADQQALMYDPGAGFNLSNALAMEPYATVGDAQAGIAARFAGANLSFAYIQRETRYALPHKSWETSEGFAAFSLTLRR